MSSRAAGTTRRTAPGFSVLELLLALGALAVLLALVLPGRGYLDTARLQAVVQDVATLRTAADRWLERGRLDYTGLTVAALRAEGLLPTGWRAQHPYGGEYAVGPTPGDPRRLTATVSALPSAAGNTLLLYYTGRVQNVTVSAGTLIVTF